MVSTGLAGSAVSVNSTSTLTANTLYHIAMTYDGTALRLYVNGAQDGSVATTLVLGSNSTQPMLGALQVTTDNRWSGWMLDVRWYGRALSETDIWQLSAPATRWDLYAPALLAGMAGGAPLLPQPQMQVVS